MTRTHRHLHSTSYTSQTYQPCPQKRGITSGDAKNKVHANRKRTRLGGNWKQ